MSHPQQPPYWQSQSGWQAQSQPWQQAQQPHPQPWQQPQWQQHPQQHPQQHQYPVGVPAKKPTNPLAVALGVMIVLIVVGIAALVVVGLRTLTEEPVVYANEDYQAPQITTAPDQFPWPGSMDLAAQWTERNGLYDQTFPSPLRCDLTTLTLDASDAEIEDQLNAMVACIMSGWDEPVTATGWTLPRPGVTVYDASGIESPCGWREDPNAFWCGANQQLYFGTHLEEYLPFDQMRFGPEIIMAHEFAHYLQGRVGIAGGMYARADTVSQQEQELLSRRHEAQADCFAGIFIHGIADYAEITQDDIDQFNRLWRILGGDEPGTEHPSGPSRVAWFNTGYATFDIGQCNTYVADPDTVA